MSCILQGNVVAILDSNNNVVISYVYDAWGRPISKTGSMAATLGTVQPFRYRGYVYDEETSIYYLRSRYYHDRWLRFINPDCIIRLQGNFSSLNQLAYCDNTPVSTNDSDGYSTSADPGLRTRIHNEVCAAVLAALQQLEGANLFGYTGSGVKVVKESGADGFVDIVLTTSLVIEVKRYTCSASKAILQLASYRKADWVGYNIREINKLVSADEYLISGIFQSNDGYWVYFEEIPGGIVLYDYGMEPDIDKFKTNVAKKAKAYERERKKLENTLMIITGAVGVAFVVGMATKPLVKSHDAGYFIRGH